MIKKGYKPADNPAEEQAEKGKFIKKGFKSKIKAKK